MSAVRKEITADSGSSLRIDSYPASEKVYIQGSRPDIRVPMRKITLSDTPAHFGAEKNPPLYVYDTSGVYTDPNVDVNLHKGLGSIRSLDRRARRYRVAERPQFRLMAVSVSPTPARRICVLNISAIRSGP